jgi:predicted secreted protein
LLQFRGEIQVIFLSFAVYFTSWWIIFAMALPIAIRPPEKPEAGHAPSAPNKVYLKQKIIGTSIITIPVTWAIMTLF